MIKLKENGYIGNTNALKYKTQEQLQEGIDAYFAKCDIDGRPYTMSGLALALGLDRKTLVNYSERDLFSTQIKNAKAKVEEQLEESLYRLGNNSGIIFNLKNNYGWTDKQELETNTQGKVTIVNSLPKGDEDESDY